MDMGISRGLICCILLAALWVGFAPAGEGQEGGKVVVERICPELPNLQCPISLIIDDPTPIFADRLPKEEIEKRRKEGKGVDWWTFFDDLTQLFDDYGMKGKFTLNSYRSDVGMIDMITDPQRKKQLDEFVSVLKKRVVPNFDITPEIISHGPVIDIKTGQPAGIKDPEHEWSRTQTEDTLEAYIGRGLTALKNVGIECNGVTSPCDFGRGNEANYARAISRALKRVNNVDFAWYFLDSDWRDHNTPRLMVLDRGHAQCLVSIVPTSKVSDIGLMKNLGPDVAKQADVHITEDGKSGVFVDMIRARSYLTFYKHWGLLYDSGKETGIQVLRVALDRLRKHHRDDVQWMKCSDIARYYAVTQICRTTYYAGDKSAAIGFQTPFACKDYTLSFHPSKKVSAIAVKGRKDPLKRLEKRPKRLDSHCWFEEGGLIHVCLDLDTETELQLRCEE